MLTVLRVPLVLCFWSLVNITMTHATPEWQKMTTNLTDTDLRVIAINPSAPSSIYAGSASALYQSTNEGRDFKAVLTPTGEFKAIRQIYISPTDSNHVYAATEAGLFESKTASQSWNRIYFSADKDEGKALCAIEDNDSLFLGTKKGVFFKKTSEINWHRIDGELNHEPIYLSAQDKAYIYFATDEKLFRFDKNTRVFKSIFTVGFGRSSQEEESEDESEDEDEEETSEIKEHRSLKFLEVSSRPNFIFLAATNGIYLSKDQGQKWERLEAASVPVEHLTFLKIISHGCPEGSLSCFSLLAVTTKGAFLYANQRWEAVYQGMETNDIRSAAVDSQENIYAATNRGIFLLAIETERGTGHVTRGTELEKALPSGLTSAADYQTLSEYFADEPSVNEVHDLAINYAEVHPNKIKSWRKLAARRAIMPSVSAGIDRGASELLHWDSGLNPDQLLRGDDFVDWDVSFSWDLADLIWNFSQTSIDTRSNAMIEIREDILDQITRLYFERRRTQMELVNLASLDAPTRFDKEMRVEELTALIDAYTGGRFSRLIEENKKRRLRKCDPSPVARDPEKNKNDR